MDAATLGSGQPPSPLPPHSSLTSLPVLAIAIFGMLTTAVLLVSYYLFVIQCRPSWRRSDHRLLRRLFPSAHSNRHLHIPSILHALAAEFHGLDPSVIRSIPVVKFSTIGTPFHDCAICLNEFQDGESLKQLPICSHAFHIDCIDTWLEFNSNCPLCRSDIRSPSAASATDHIVIFAPRREQRHEDEAPAADPSPRGKGKKCHASGSMGDECIDARGKCEQMWVQPVRRSFSMDSCDDRQFYLSIQEILRQRQNNREGEGSTSNGVSRGEGGGGSGRVRRSLFSFGRSSRNSVIPIEEGFDVSLPSPFGNFVADTDAK